MSKRHHTDYDEVTTTRCERALVTLLGDIGPWNQRVYLVGGLAPRYIVGSLPAGARPHVGTTDVDLVIRLAVEDDSHEGVPHPGEQPQEGRLQGRAVLPVEANRRGSHRDGRVSVRNRQGRTRPHLQAEGRNGIRAGSVERAWRATGDPGLHRLHDRGRPPGRWRPLSGHRASSRTSSRTSS